jgi:hypothetical protein
MKPKDKTIYLAMRIGQNLLQSPSRVRAYKKATGNSVKQMSDGHHTFEDLYTQRRILSKIIFELASQYAWKSKLHADHTMFDGDFIVGISIPEVGQYSYHYKLKYWDEFNVRELPTAPPYDGHQPEDINRLLTLIPLLKKTEGQKNDIHL